MHVLDTSHSPRQQFCAYKPIRKQHQTTLSPPPVSLGRILSTVYVGLRPVIDRRRHCVPFRDGWVTCLRSPIDQPRACSSHSTVRHPRHRHSLVRLVCALQTRDGLAAVRTTPPSSVDRMKIRQLRKPRISRPHARRTPACACRTPTRRDGFAANPRPKRHALWLCVPISLLPVLLRLGSVRTNPAAQMP